MAKLFQLSEDSNLLTRKPLYSSTPNSSMKSHHRGLPLTVLIPMLIGFTTSLIAQPSGLISWWQGEGNVLDSVGSNNGALNVPLSYTAGQSGQAFSISGGIVQIPD